MLNVIGNTIGSRSRGAAHWTVLAFTANEQDFASGVNAAVASVDAVAQFRFISIVFPVGLPATMELELGAELFMVIDFSTDYLGRPFVMVDDEGIQHRGVFTNGTVSF